MEPLIGITCGREYKNVERFYTNSSYIRAVEKAGGIAVLLPALENNKHLHRLVNLVDAVLLPGGDDIDPVFFGEEPVVGLGEVDPVRDEAEIAVASSALQRGIPILGICRGMQLLNITAGGTLYQDISRRESKNAVQHMQTAPRSYASHHVQIVPNSLLAAMFRGANCIRVNSSHHQAVKKIAPGFVATAEARDGIIEAIESNQHSFVVGVQWHPEVMWELSPEQLAVFTEFIKAAQATSQ